ADDSPLDPECPCEVCQRWSRAYLRHLLMVGEPTALRLLTWHNLTYVLALVGHARDAIASGTLEAFRRDVRSIWDPAST
ncbi:MAG TPA: tRNA-guanine transglycosylase, partial [Acidimicrobiales bacterium]|nr:tRNA-guanine transglycosylase [Acidimicrobiales bacterium]